MPNDFKYQLQPYHGMGTRHRCPSCGDAHSFTLYVDEQGNPLDESVGRCDHESGCGYHYTPSQFFADNPEQRPRYDGGYIHHMERKPYASPYKRMGTRQPSAIGELPFSYVVRSASFRSTFIQFLCTIFDIDSIKRIAEQYAIGATKAGDVIFWQIDKQGRVRCGKIIKYNPQTGHRIKDGAGHIDWVHSRLKKAGIIPQDWSLSQCLFGEHLLKLSGNESKSIALVESEKTAIIGAIQYPEYIWMATGGIGNLNEERMDALRGRSIIIFPDVDGTEKWKEKAAAIRGCKVIVSDILERNATLEEKEAKIDIADWIIRCAKEGEKVESQPSPISIDSTKASFAEEHEPQWNQKGIPTMIHQSSDEEEKAVEHITKEHPSIGDMMKALDLSITGFKQYADDEAFQAAILEPIRKNRVKAAANSGGCGICKIQ